MNGKLHEKLFISTCSFLWINESGWEFVLKKLMMKNSFIEKTYVAGTYWNCLYEAIPMCTYNICYWKQGRKLFGNLHFPRLLSIVFTSFKHPKLPISIKIPVILLQIVYLCMTAISPNSSSWTTSWLTCKFRSCYICCIYIQVHLMLDFYMENQSKGRSRLIVIPPLQRAFKPGYTPLSNQVYW